MVCFQEPLGMPFRKSQVTEECPEAWSPGIAPESGAPGRHQRSPAPGRSAPASTGPPEARLPWPGVVSAIDAHAALRALRIVDIALADGKHQAMRHAANPPSCARSAVHSSRGGGDWPSVGVPDVGTTADTRYIWCVLKYRSNRVHATDLSTIRVPPLAQNKHPPGDQSGRRHHWYATLVAGRAARAY